jgi:hypothetical protein
MDGRVPLLPRFASKGNGMRRFLASGLALFLLALLSGCGPSATELREKTLSRLNTVADTWDGVPDFKTTETDSYGRPIVATVSKGTLNYELELRSHGPDGLPKNSDDIVVHRYKPKPHGDSTIHKEIEKASESVGLGGVRGVIQGAKEALHGKANDPAAKKQNP